MKNTLGLLAGILTLSIISIAAFAQGYQVGDQARDFKLKNIDGKTVSLEGLNSKGAIVIFTCNHCPFSQAYENRIIELHELYAKAGYPVVAINPNDPDKQPEDSFKKMQERAKSKKFPFVYLVDETQEIARTYGASKTPHVYLLQKQDDDVFTVAYIGAIDNNVKSAEQANKHYVKDAMKQVLEGAEVETPSTKAVGCTIKWRES